MLLECTVFSEVGQPPPHLSPKSPANTEAEMSESDHNPIKNNRKDPKSESGDIIFHV